jgi:hypothetical protein
LPLKLINSLALDIFNDLDTKMFRDYIERWPNPDKLKSARQVTLKSFFKSHRSGQESLMNRHFELIQTAISLTDDVAIIEPYQ